jgi:hypothetical protein
MTEQTKKSVIPDYTYLVFDVQSHCLVFAAVKLRGRNLPELKQCAHHRKLVVVRLG